MAQLSVTIGGRLYRIACEEGQEAHLEALSADVDRRIAQMRASFGEIGDQRLTVMASIALVDELTEAKRKLAQMEADVQLVKDRATNAKIEAQVNTNALLDTIESLTHRVEAMLRHFSTPPA
jgi:cell division protein ZapA